MFFSNEGKKIDDNVESVEASPIFSFFSSLDSSASSSLPVGGLSFSFALRGRARRDVLSTKKRLLRQEKAGSTRRPPPLRLLRRGALRRHRRFFEQHCLSPGNNHFSFLSSTFRPCQWLALVRGAHPRRHLAASRDRRGRGVPLHERASARWCSSGTDEGRAARERSRCAPHPAVR